MRFAMTKCSSLFVACFLAYALSGCAEMPIDPMPSFANPFFLPTRLIPVSMVEKQIQCEMREFLDEMDGTDKFSPRKGADNAQEYLAYDGPATVVLNLQTDQSGKVIFTGIDTAKLGLDFLTPFITLSNKIPSLQSNLQAKGTVYAQVTFVIPQTKFDIIDYNTLKTNTNGKSTLDPKEITTITQLAQFVGAKTQVSSLRLLPVPHNGRQALAVVDPKDIERLVGAKGLKGIGHEYHSDIVDYHGENRQIAYDFLTYNDSIVYSDSPIINGSADKKLSNARLIKGLASINCNNWNEYNPLQRFNIANWMTDYFRTKIRAEANQLDENIDVNTSYYGDKELFKRIRDNSSKRSVACMKELQLKTQVVAAFDISAGVNPIFNPAYILPVSGVSLDYNPQNTEFMQMTFTLNNSENQDLCNKLLPRSPIAGNKI
jgi:hypothetical protein